MSSKSRTAPSTSKHSTSSSGSSTKPGVSASSSSNGSSSKNKVSASLDSPKLSSRKAPTAAVSASVESPLPSRKAPTTTVSASAESPLPSRKDTAPLAKASDKSKATASTTAPEKPRPVKADTGNDDDLSNDNAGASDKKHSSGRSYTAEELEAKEQRRRERHARRKEEEARGDGDAANDEESPEAKEQRRRERHQRRKEEERLAAESKEAEETAVSQTSEQRHSARDKRASEREAAMLSMLTENSAAPTRASVNTDATVLADNDVAPKQAEDEYNVPDDFEDYEEDFEEEEEGQNENDDDEQGQDGNADLADDADEYIPAVPVSKESQLAMEALQAENARVQQMRRREKQAQLKSQAANDVSDDPTEPVALRMNFRQASAVASIKQVASKTERRFADLRKMIELDTITIDLFELPPMSEYEVYIKNFGRSDNRQASTQYNDSAVEHDVQTDVITMRTRWTQEPPADLRGCGAIGPESETDYDATSKPAEEEALDGMALSRFLQASGQVCCALLDERAVLRQEARDATDYSFCDHQVKLQSGLPLLAGRSIQNMHFSTSQTNRLLVAYGLPAFPSSSDRYKNTGVVCVWDASRPANPLNVLVCHGAPTVVCFGSESPNLVFAGTADGSIVLWDLREPLSSHKTKYSAGDTNITLQYPSYSTDGVDKAVSHISKVVSLLPIDPPKQSLDVSAISNVHAAVSFQLASLDEDGNVKTWSVVELNQASNVVDSELGLRPGSFVKISYSATLQLNQKLKYVGGNNFDEQVSAVTATCLAFMPGSSTHFLVGTSKQHVLHGIRFGEAPYPSSFRGPSDSACLSLQFSPFEASYFLASFSNGDVVLFNIAQEHPVYAWPGQSHTIFADVAWSQKRPSVFYAFSSPSSIVVWDLLQTDGPLMSEKLKGSNEDQQSGRTEFCSYSSPVRKAASNAPDFAIANSSGAISVYTGTEKLSAAQQHEDEAFNEFLVHSTY